MGKLNDPNITGYAWKYNHKIDSDQARIIDREHSQTRKTVESWHTAVTKEAENYSRVIPVQYSIPYCY